jgi:hypothetical protein
MAKKQPSEIELHRKIKDLTQAGDRLVELFAKDKPLAPGAPKARAVDAWRKAKSG